MSLLDTIRSKGFSIRTPDGRRIVVSPADKLTDSQRQRIRDRKDELLAELEAEETKKVLALLEGRNDHGPLMWLLDV